VRIPSPSPPVAAFARVTRTRRSFRSTLCCPVDHLSRLNRTARWVARPLCRSDLGSPPAAGTFTPELSPNESPPLGVRYNYGADWAINPGGTFTRWNSGFLSRT
jgi:hypothetical protein